LNERQVIACVTLLGTHDAGRDRGLQAERRADGDDPFADTQFGNVTRLDGRQARRIDLQHGDIGAFVDTDRLGLELPLVRQCDQHFRGIFDDVGVRHDVAIAREDEARCDAPGAAFLFRLGPVGARWRARRTGRSRCGLPEKPAEELLHFLVGFGAAGRATPRRHLFDRANVHDRGADLLGKIGKIRQATGLRYRRHRRPQRHRCGNRKRTHQHVGTKPLPLNLGHHRPFNNRTVKTILAGPSWWFDSSMRPAHSTLPY